MILPPLLSLFDGIEQVAAEMAELGGRGWYAFCEFLPSVPYRHRRAARRHARTAGRLEASSIKAARGSSLSTLD
eukprot:1378634-Prymnesium_polylepis.1